MPSRIYFTGEKTIDVQEDVGAVADALRGGWAQMTLLHDGDKVLVFAAQALYVRDYDAVPDPRAAIID